MNAPSGYFGHQVSVWIGAVGSAAGLALIAVNPDWPTLTRAIAGLAFMGMTPTGRDLFLGPRAFQRSLEDMRSGRSLEHESTSTPDPGEKPESDSPITENLQVPNQQNGRIAEDQCLRGWVLLLLLLGSMTALTIFPLKPFWIRPASLVFCGLGGFAVAGYFRRYGERVLHSGP